MKLKPRVAVHGHVPLVTFLQTQGVVTQWVFRKHPKDSIGNKFRFN